MITLENVDSWDMTELKNKYEENGFVLGGKILSDETVDLLNEKIEFFLNDKNNTESSKLAKMGGNAKETIWQCMDLWQKIDDVADIIRSEKLRKILLSICEEKEFRVYQDQLQFKPAKIGGVNCWHQDIEFWPFKEPYTEITGWIALDDVNEDNGCMRMVPGSHKWGEAQHHLKSLEHYLPLPNTYLNNNVEVHSCIVPKGYIHFHHHLTWHGSGMNLSHKPRRALAFHIVGGKVYYQPKNSYGLKGFELHQEVTGEQLPIVGTRFDPWPMIQARLASKTPVEA